MEGAHTVRINNRLYDATTGLPIESGASVEAVATDPQEPTQKHSGGTHAESIHVTQQRSNTLHGRAVKKPALSARPHPGRNMDIMPSQKVSRFANTIQPISQPSVHKSVDTADVPAIDHPTVKRALAAVSQPQMVISATPQQIKNEAIAAALAPSAEKGDTRHREPLKKRRLFNKKIAIISLIVLAVLALAGVAYVSLPTLSVSVAASQAGINATYPKYVPDGYKLAQPVTFKDGTVALTFKSNAGMGEYTVTQARSSWNSTAVLDNVVRKAAGENYVTNQERGLTIYSYDGNAAWVNAGILYTIDSSAPLSSDQIRRIATSLS